MSTPISEPRRIRLRIGFTLIEVVGAVAAFTIAFLAGSAAFARLLQQQNTSYQRTLAASAAMLVADWNVDKRVKGAGAGFLNNTADLLEPPGGTPATETLKDNTHLHFQGDDAGKDDTIRVFRKAVLGYENKELETYQSLVLTVSPVSLDESSAPGGIALIRWRQVTFWQGRAEDVRVPRAATMHYLARYLIPDDCP